jgi:hypothetical protein
MIQTQQSDLTVRFWEVERASWARSRWAQNCLEKEPYKVSLVWKAVKKILLLLIEGES